MMYWCDTKLSSSCDGKNRVPSAHSCAMSQYGFDSECGTYTYSGLLGPPNDSSRSNPFMRHFVPGSLPVPLHASNIAAAEWSMTYCVAKLTGLSVIVCPLEFGPF